MKLKETNDITWEDLPKIESPFYACKKIERHWHDPINPIWGMNDIINKSYSCLHPSQQRHNQHVLSNLLEKIEHGKIFLLHDFGAKPFDPVVISTQNEKATERKHYEIKLSSPCHLYFRSNLERKYKNLSAQQSVQSESNSSLFSQVIGGTKYFANQFVKHNAALQAEWFAEQGAVQFTDKETGKILSPQEVKDAYKTDGREKFILKNLDEQTGADIVESSAASAAVITAVTAVMSRFRSVVRNPKEFASDLKKALTNSRSESEALGKLGMEQAKHRLGHKTDPRYVDRYHGPDDMTKNKGGKLAEWEAKGNKTDSTTVAKDKDKNKQGSRKKNAKRSQKMLKKNKKVNVDSNRQGGPYTHDEIDLWEEIFEEDGEKQHISVHTNTETGKIRVFERNNTGEIDKILDDFEMDNFDEMKQVIKETMKTMQEAK